MAFSISYTYKIIDKYTPKLREIQKQTQSFNKTLRHTAEASRIAGKNLQSLGGVAGTAARSVNRATGKMNKPMGNFGKRVDSLNGKMNNFGRSAGGLATTVVGGLFFRKAIKASFDYEQSIINLTKKFDELAGPSGAKRLEAFQVEMTKVGNAIGQSKTQMNALAFEAGKMGIPLEEIGKFGLLSGKVAVAFNMALGDSTESLARLRDKMGLTGGGLVEVLDIVNAAGDGTTAKVTQILNVTGRLAGMFKTLKMPSSAAVGFSAVANQLENSPEKAATQLKIFLQRLTTVEKVGSGIVRAMFKDAPGTINKVLAKLRSMDQMARTAAIQETFGAEASTFVLNLVGSQALLNKTLGLTADKTKTVGTVQREFNRQIVGGKFKADQMKAANENLAASLGDVLKPVVKDIIDSLTEMATKFAAFAKEHPTLTKLGLALAAIATVAAPMAITISALASAVLWLPKVAWIASVGTWALTAATTALSGALGLASTAGLPLLSLLWTIALPFVAIAAGIAMVTLGLAVLWKSGGTGGWLDTTIKPMIKWLDKLLGMDVSGWLDRTMGGIIAMSGPIGDFLGLNDDEQSINVKKQTSNQTNVNGSIKVEAEQGTKVRQGSLKSSSPGNLGMNIAGAT